MQYVFMQPTEAERAGLDLQWGAPSPDGRVVFTDRQLMALSSMEGMDLQQRVKQTGGELLDTDRAIDVMNKTDKDKDK